MLTHGNDATQGALEGQPGDKGKSPNVANLAAINAAVAIFPLRPACPEGREERWAVPAYNKQRVSEEFRQEADLADAAFRANLSNLSADPTAVRAHDELLARSCVYGYLYDRHFLQSAELLLNELRWLRGTNRPDPPRNAIHPQRFSEARNQILDLLASRFQNLIDYRDQLGNDAPEAEPPPARITARQPVLGESVSQSPVSDPDKD